MESETPTRHHVVISFDIGIKNLAYCVARVNTTIDEICRWEITDISGGKGVKIGFEGICEGTLKALDDVMDSIRSRFGSSCDVTVFIENQPAVKAPTMKSIQIIIYTYFKLLPDCTPKLISASTKNRFLQSQGIDVKVKDYRGAKAASIKHITEYLTARPHMSDQLAKLQASKKKDDLADSLLQALAVLEKN